jgi:cysteine synthase
LSPPFAHAVRPEREARKTANLLGRCGNDAPYAIEGIRASEAPDNLHRSILDGAESISDDESFVMVHRLIREEGMLVGGSSGTNVAAAVRVAKNGGLSGPAM